MFGKLCWRLLTNEANNEEGEFIPKSLVSFELAKSLRKGVDAPYLLEMMLHTVVQDYKRRWTIEQIENCLRMQKAVCNGDSRNSALNNKSLVLKILDVHYDGYIISEKENIQKIL